MTNVPNLEPMSAQDAYDSGYDVCDICQKPHTQWPTGLMLVDRESGYAAGTMVTCPDCIKASTSDLVSLVRRRVLFDHINWYWFTAPEIPEGE